MLLKKPLVWLIAIASWLCVLEHTQGATQALYVRLEALGRKSLDLDYSYGVRQQARRRVRYRLFLPNPFDPSFKYPLIVWLHGFGDYGTDNLSQLVHLDETLFPGGETQACQFFVCAPQCSHGSWLTELGDTNENANHSPGDSDPDMRDMLDATLRIMDNLQTQYPIDERRITLVGISDGGTACWTVLSRHPHRFASVVPLADSGASGVSLGSIISSPIWAFHAAGDPRSPIEGVANTINSIKAAGGKAHLTLTDDNRHDCWTKAFAEHDLLCWILKQRLDDPTAPLPGSYPWAVRLRIWWNENWPAIVLFSTAIGLLTASYRHLRRIPSSGSSELSPDTRIAAMTSSLGSYDRDDIDILRPEPTPLRSDFRAPDFSKIGNDL